MAEVKWIKLSVSIPDNKKIKRIRKMPDGNNIVLFWVFLLARAGESNQKGGLFFTENVPYTDEDLAADFDFNIEFVKFARITLEKYKMIELYDDVVFIKNWDEYQQMDKLEKIKEQNRIRQAKYKEKQQQLANSNVSVTLPVTQGNATDIELDLDLELDIDLDLDIEKEQQQYSRTKNSAPPAYKLKLNAQTFYQQNFGVASPIIIQSIDFWIDDLNEELVIEALRRAALDQKGYRYAEGILKNWDKKGLKTLDEIKSEDIAFENSKNKPRYGGQPTRKESLPDWAQEGYEPPESKGSGWTQEDEEGFKREVLGE